MSGQRVAEPEGELALEHVKACVERWVHVERRAALTGSERGRDHGERTTVMVPSQRAVRHEEQGDGGTSFDDRD